MANHNLAVDKLLNYGLRQSHLDNVLASNCVMDWFGRTFIGQRKIIDFYQNSNATHEHSMTNVTTSDAFEDRPYHLLTREQPLENMKSAPDLLTGDEQWFDCETHSPVDLKEGQRTPLNRSTPLIRCPPAPCRYGNKFEISDDETDEHDDDSDGLNESGIRPLDSSAIELMREKTEKSPSCKRIRREETQVEEPSEPIESRFSELYYLEASGSVTIKRDRSMSSNEPDKRDCKMLISYRVCKEDPAMIQIALIVYKCNSKNPKSRRNLMSQFEVKSDEASPLSKPSTSQCRTTEKDQKKSEDEKRMEVFTAPAAGSKFSKATKRPISKTSLRF